MKNKVLNLFLTVMVLGVFAAPVCVDAAPPAKGPFPGQLQKWHGFDMYVNGGNKVVVPKKAADGKPWVWRARFWGHEPQFDIAMLNSGYHVVYCDVGNMFGSPKAVARWNEYYTYLRFEHLFADRVGARRHVARRPDDLQLGGGKSQKSSGNLRRCSRDGF